MINYIEQPTGRFGNNILQLINVLYICLKDNTKFDICDDFKIPFIDIKKIPFYTVSKIEERKASTFWNVNVSDEDRWFIVQQYIKPYSNFQVTVSLDKTCIIHIRSGDIFNDNNINKTYIQPPFAFYKKFIDEHSSYDKFLIVTETDRRNPVITLLENYSSKVTVQSSTFKEDVSVILGAEIVVFGYGTFVPTLLLFSEKIKEIHCMDYVFRRCFKGSSKKVKKNLYKFLKPYILEWKNSQDQIALMKNFKEQDIELIVKDVQQDISTYKYCAKECESFFLTDLSHVAYGGADSYNFLYAKKGKITFDNKTFGDPVLNSPKSGFYKVCRGYNKDYFIEFEIRKLVAIFSINQIIETGTNHGDTTKELAELCSVLTMEINPEYKYSDMPDNIEFFTGDSVEGLKMYLHRFKEKNVLFYLDAHWRHVCPLLGELSAIADNPPKKSIIVIHDFKVPNQPDFGFDTYNGQSYTFDWIQPLLNNIYHGNFKYYYNYVAEGAKRGVIFIFPV